MMNKQKVLSGQVKGEAIMQFGKMTNNESMDSEGRLDKGKGKLKEDVSRAFNHSSRD